jgi:hypothetical protein
LETLQGILIIGLTMISAVSITWALHETTRAEKLEKRLLELRRINRDLKEKKENAEIKKDFIDLIF